jgi:surfeit locus 1 family protein
LNQLTSPKWIGAHIVVVVVAFVFINLGLWQLRRLDQVRLNNVIAASRYDSPPEDLWALLDSVGDDLESLEYRRVVVAGEFDTANQILTRNQVYRDTAGFHVVTPLLTPSIGAVLVNRGWVPLELDSPNKIPSPPALTVGVEGWIRLTQLRPALGPVDPAQTSTKVFSRIDIARLQDQMPYDLAPVYIVLQGGSEQGDLPIPLAAPQFNDEGPHLGYAIQWFGFTLIGLVGYAALIRRTLLPKKTRTT